jgi:Ras family protein
VPPSEGEELAKLNKAAWVETSAKNNVNVGMQSSLFELLSFLRRLITGKVFELCLAEIEKRSASSQTDQPEAGRCLVM